MRLSPQKRARKELFFAHSLFLFLNSIAYRSFSVRFLF